MDLGLSGRPALVAAASRGLGKASAMALAAEGARVAICSRDRAAVGAARDEIASLTGTEVVALVADVSRQEDAVRFVREGAEAVGGCHVLVANAGGPAPGLPGELSDEDFRRAFELTFFSTVRMTREALPHMRKAGFGRVVIVSSIAAKQPIHGLATSNAARPAVLGWARSLADEVAGQGITVNAVLPGRVFTERTRELVADRAARASRSFDDQLRAEARDVPVGRLGDPMEVGDVVAFLASERASYLTGCFMQVDGGLYRGLL